MADRSLLFVLQHITLIVSTSLDHPPYFLLGRLPHPIQGSVLGGIPFYDPNGAKHPYIIGIVPVSIAVPLVLVLDVISIFLIAIISRAPVLFRIW